MNNLPTSPPIMLNLHDKQPRKVYVELTTRCNLQCRMCVKEMADSDIPETDMPLSVFKKLLPSLGSVRELILNGIGEPLLHPDLVQIIQLARSGLAPEATIGFQSNGVLLNMNNAAELIEAGLDTICLSVDRFADAPIPVSGNKREHSFAAVSRAVSSLCEAREKAAANLKIGFEVVLTRDTLHELPELVAWAAQNGVNYILTSHLILYDQDTEKASLFNPNPESAVRLLHKYSDLAARQGVTLQECYSSYKKFAGTRSDNTVRDLFTGLQREAEALNIRLNLSGLLEHDRLKASEIEAILAKAGSIAKKNDVLLYLPPLRALDKRECPFMTEKATFISANGDVMPCHFLWHTYSCRVLHEEVRVKKRVFGNISRNPIETIWQGEDYSAFREEAGQYDYSPCWSCSFGPCSNLVNDNADYANDCFGSQVPCGHCQWSLGGTRCL